MNKNSLIGFILIAAIMIGYTYWFTPSADELAKKQYTADSLARVEQQRIETERARLTQMQEAATPEQPAAEVIESLDDNYQALRDKYAEFAGAAKGTQASTIIENDLFKVEISNKGGHIQTVELKDYKTYDSLPLILLDPQSSRFALTFFAKNRLVNTEDLYFTPSTAETHLEVSGDEVITFSMRLYTDLPNGEKNTSAYIEYLYSIRGDNYMFDFDINMVGLDDIISANNRYVGLNWYADLRKQELSQDQWNGSTIYFKYLSDDVEYMSETDDDEEQIATKLKWVSYKQRFFSSTIIALEAFENGKLTVTEKNDAGNDRYLKTMESEFELPINLSGTTHIPLSFYFGPNNFNTLKAYDLDLERQIPIGWSFFLLAWINEYIVIFVFDWLGGFGWNYGIVILVLTIMLKIVLFPIAYKTYYSSAKMRVLKPEIDEIGKKFPKQEDAMKKQQAVMALYRQAGVNPAAGCVPMLLQMPILFAMFKFFPASIELRQQPFLWATDLSSYDSIAQLPFTIPFYGDHVSLFTLLMTVSTIMYTYMNNQMMSAQTQMPGMKTMMYLMPIMFLGIFNDYASGLSYYYFLANVITIGQMYLFRHMIDEDKIRAQLQANKKKGPVKKSNFQKRLEKMAKEKGMQLPK